MNDILTELSLIDILTFLLKCYFL